ncbi:DUF3194 domain-containing protein [Candidatus Bathycorpusculum sp.]|jgi:hypothetical protein|uniref:DUF3194 domain-containing protein n=1 Tax=Candidatus Bathycorpusculum sp. TaxID=2994959 RepID=UPI002835BDFD|nr:DUF3194 domain-containing protein [Candidatus Termitimicrobium sp.]MCL2684910.1 DUF3194 domain-containing protein [Candidatus Termitimicrobium sp.]
MLLDELGFPELTAEQIELLCQTTEDGVRKYILNQVSSKNVNQLDIFVEVEGTKPVNVSVEVELVLTKQAEAIDADALVKQAVDAGHAAAENFLRKIQ